MGWLQIAEEAIVTLASLTVVLAFVTRPIRRFNKRQDHHEETHRLTLETLQELLLDEPSPWRRHRLRQQIRVQLGNYDRKGQAS